jgi:hypothetical protein
MVRKSLQILADSPIEVDGINPQAITTFGKASGQKGQGTLQGQPILASNSDIYPIDSVMLENLRDRF